MSDLPARPDADVGTLYAEVRSRLLDARATVARSVNEEMVRAYWAIGELIEVHIGSIERPEAYGKALVEDLAVRLSIEFGRGFDATNLRMMRQFFNSFEMCAAPRRTSSDELPARIDRPMIAAELSWTHYRMLVRVHDPAARSFYMSEAIRSRWSTRELERQITTRYFERGLGAQPVGGDVEVADPQTLLRDPYVLEFVGLPDRYSYSERELERALVDQLQAFLLELGRGFSFVGRQQRVTIDGDHWYVDLVFYNYLLKAFVLIDLKAGKLDHGDIGQMDFYVRYWEAEVRGADDNPTIGLILCAERSEAIARYTLLADHQSIFAAKYLPFLPSETELEQELRRERHVFEMRRLGAGDD